MFRGCDQKSIIAISTYEVKIQITKEFLAKTNLRNKNFYENLHETTFLAFIEAPRGKTLFRQLGGIFFWKIKK